MSEADRAMFNLFQTNIGIEVGMPYKLECKCERKAYYDALENARMAAIISERKNRLCGIGAIDTQTESMTFESDQGYNADISAKAKRYVDNFDKMLEDNIGLVFTGGVGTGKTFFAACIANALTKKDRYVIMTSFSRIIRVQFDDIEKVLKEIERADLVVFDDVGSERDTSFAFERAFDAVDARIRAKKPIIVTTNYSPEELGSTKDLRERRIYDRILGACIVIPVLGQSLRRTEQKSKTDEARAILLGKG